MPSATRTESVRTRLIDAGVLKPRVQRDDGINVFRNINQAPVLRVDARAIPSVTIAKEETMTEPNHLSDKFDEIAESLTEAQKLAYKELFRELAIAVLENTEEIDTTSSANAMTSIERIAKKNVVSALHSWLAIRGLSQLVRADAKVTVY